MDNESSSIHLNLANIGSEIRKPSQIIYTICIWVNLGKVQGTFFCRIYKELKTTGYNNRLQNYKITKFTVFVRSGSGSDDGGGQVQIKGEGRVQILASLWIT